MQTGTLTPEQAGLADLEPGTYLVNEIFYSIQGEGVLTGVPMVFVRFSKCNLRCSKGNAGFDCDTEFESGRAMTACEIFEAVALLMPEDSGWVLFTGGEPMLQLDDSLLETFIGEVGFMVAVETNGTIMQSYLMEDHEQVHICVSPKSAWHTLAVRRCTELKMVRQAGQALPEIDELPIRAVHYLVSPAFRADGRPDMEAMAWCVDLVKEDPRWRLSLQTHKLVGVR